MDGVHEPEAGVAEIEVDARGGEAELVMHGTGDRRLEVVLAHRRGDEHADLGRIDARLVDGLAAGHRRSLIERDTIGPPAALLDAGELGEQPGSHAPTLVGGRELLVDPDRCDDLGRLDRCHRDHSRSAMRKTGVPVHVTPIQQPQHCTDEDPRHTDRRPNRLPRRRGPRCTTLATCLLVRKGASASRSTSSSAPEGVATCIAMSSCRRNRAATERPSCSCTVAAGCRAIAASCAATASCSHATASCAWPRSTGCRAKPCGRRRSTTSRPRCAGCVPMPTTTASTPPRSLCRATAPGLIWR